MKKLCGYCRQWPALPNGFGYCDVCLFSLQQAGIKPTRIAPVVLHPIPPLIEVNARLAAWLQEHKQ
jgi:hypothetical protein